MRWWKYTNALTEIKKRQLSLKVEDDRPHFGGSYWKPLHWQRLSLTTPVGNEGSEANLAREWPNANFPTPEA